MEFSRRSVLVAAGGAASCTFAQVAVGQSLDEEPDHWIVLDEPANGCSPSIVDGIVYIPAGTSLYALNPADDSIHWQAEDVLGAPIQLGAAPTIADDLCYILADGELIALDRESGEERWRVETAGDVEGTPMISKGRCITGGDDGVYAFDALTGDELWANTDRGERVESTPNVAGDRCYVNTQESTLCLAVESGEERWRFEDGGYGPPVETLEAPEQPVPASPVVHEDLLITPSEGGVYLLERNRGMQRDHIGLAWNGRIDTPTVYDSSIYTRTFIEPDGDAKTPEYSIQNPYDDPTTPENEGESFPVGDWAVAHKVNLLTREIEWVIPGFYDLASPTFVAGNGTSRGVLTARGLFITESGDTKWTTGSDSNQSSPLADAGTAVIGGKDGVRVMTLDETIHSRGSRATQGLVGTTTERYEEVSIEPAIELWLEDETIAVDQRTSLGVTLQLTEGESRAVTSRADISVADDSIVELLDQETLVGKSPGQTDLEVTYGELETTRTIEVSDDDRLPGLGTVAGVTGLGTGLAYLAYNETAEN